MDSLFLLRLKKEGYEISFNPRADGKCFFHAAAFQLGLGTETVRDLVFDYLERNQFDVSESRKSYNLDKLFLEKSTLTTPGGLHTFNAYHFSFTKYAIII